MDCLFCAIAQGDIPCHKVAEDEHTLAFLDVNPLVAGHALVIPKAHAAKLSDLAPDDASALIHATQQVVPAVLAAVGAPDATIAVNDGPAAGQAIPHVHVHIVPRTEDDAAGSIHSLFPHAPKPADDELADLAAKITQQVPA